ncbi:MAG: right-handed parallel beta-helix repeat-containing protein [Myxococcales bacterium]|nr:right-handed parallel beta-helix repeat-containing protein [Myxococcales bacterium]
MRDSKSGRAGGDGSGRVRRGLLRVARVAFGVLVAGSAAGATFEVNSTGDAADLAIDGACDTGGTVLIGSRPLPECTLRAAIQEANATSGPSDDIVFSAFLPVGTSGIAVIRPTTALPPITRRTRILGRTAPGYDALDPYAVPVVVLDGGSLRDPGEHGLLLQGDVLGSRIEALAIVDFPGDGIHLGAGSEGVSVLGCHVGLLSGSFARGNGGHGVFVDPASNGHAIGFQQIADPDVVPELQTNVISANAGSGLRVEGWGVRIAGNFVGTGRFGSFVSVPFGGYMGNGLWGIDVLADFTTVGGYFGSSVFGTGEWIGNVVAGNLAGGVHVGGGANLVTVQSNRVGTNDAGTTALGNGVGPGVLLDGGASELTIGSAFEFTSIAENGGNVVSGHATHGIRIDATGSPVALTANRIGTSADGETALPNDGIGIVTSPQAAALHLSNNLVSGNGDHAIVLNASGHTLFGNRIGVSWTGAPLGNLGHGVVVNGSDVQIGAPPDAPALAAGGRNRIAYNASDGVRVQNASSQRVTVRANEIHQNGGIAIDLGPNGLNANDAGDLDEGANRLMNKPVLDPLRSFWSEATQTLVVGHWLNVDPTAATHPITVDFYLAEPGDFGPAQLVGTVFLDASESDGSLQTAYLTAVPWVVVDDQSRLVAVATDAAGNTGEGSNVVLLPEPATGAGLLLGVGCVFGLGRRRVGSALRGGSAARRPAREGRGTLARGRRV